MDYIGADDIVQLLSNLPEDLQNTISCELLRIIREENNGKPLEKEFIDNWLRRSGILAESEISNLLM